MLWAKESPAEALAVALTTRGVDTLRTRIEIDLREKPDIAVALEKTLMVLERVDQSAEARLAGDAPGWAWPRDKPLNFVGRIDNDEPVVVMCEITSTSNEPIPWRTTRRPTDGGDSRRHESPTVQRSLWEDSVERQPQHLSWTRGSGSIPWNRTPAAGRGTLANAICRRLHETAAGHGHSALSILHTTVPRSPTKVRIAVQTSDVDAPTAMQMRLTRVPRWIDFAMHQPLVAVKVDGLPLTSPVAECFSYRPRDAPQGAFSFSRRLRWVDGRDVFDVILDTMRALQLDDQRSPLLGDVMLIATLTAALENPVTVPDRMGAMLIAQGRDTPGNRLRFNRAADVADSAKWRDPKTGKSLPISRAESTADGVCLARPAWMRIEGPGQQWRYTGLLFRQLGTIATRASRGGNAAHVAGLMRMVSGFETILFQQSPRGGRRKHARTPDALIAETPGGPGPVVAVPWRTALAISGEHVPEEETSLGSAARRYRKRRDALLDRGYLVRSQSPADANDTIEIVDIIKGKSQDGPGLAIRATARFIQALHYQDSTLVPLRELPMLAGLETPRSQK